MSYINDDKILIKMDKALIMKNIRVCLIYGILSLIVTIFWHIGLYTALCLLVLLSVL